MAPKKNRRLRPSKALAVSAPSAAAFTPLIVAGLEAAGIPVTPAFAAAAGPALMALIAYFTRGGRAGEGD